MNLYKFDMTKLTWSAQNVGTTGFRIAGTNIRINNDLYFNEFSQILKNIVNNRFKLILVDNIRKESYTCECIKVIGYDIVNQKFKEANPTKDNVAIECLIREDSSRFTQANITNYSLYLSYE